MSHVVCVALAGYPSNPNTTPSPSRGQRSTTSKASLSTVLYLICLALAWGVSVASLYQRPHATPLRRSSSSIGLRPVDRADPIRARKYLPYGPIQESCGWAKLALPMGTEGSTTPGWDTLRGWTFVLHSARLIWCEESRLEDLHPRRSSKGRRAAANRRTESGCRRGAPSSVANTRRSRLCPPPM